MTIPHTFVSGGLISASQVNENFAAVSATVATLAELATTTIYPTVNSIQIAARTSVSPTAPATYVRVASNPGIALSGQDAGGSWWKIDGTNGIDVRAAGLAFGGDLATIAPTVFEASNRMIVPAGGFTLSDVILDVANSTIVGLPGNLITAAATATTDSTGFRIAADAITFDSLNFQGVAGTADNIIADIDRWIHAPNPSGTYPATKRTWDGLTIQNCRFFGGGHGAVLYNLSNARIENNYFEWSINTGLSLGGELTDCSVNNNKFRYISCSTNPNGGAGGLVVGQITTVATTGTLTNSSNSITNVVSKTGVAVGFYIFSNTAGIPSGTTITGITGTGPYTFTISNNFTGTTTAGANLQAVSTRQGLTIRNFRLVGNEFAWNGWYGATLSAVPTGQSGLDCNGYSFENFFAYGNTFLHNGNQVEVKKSSDPTSPNHYQDFFLSGNKFVQMMPGSLPHITFRHLSTNNPSWYPTDYTRSATLSGNEVFCDPVSQVFTLNGSTSYISTTSGSRLVTVTAPGNWATNNEVIKILNVGAIGGIPAWQLQEQHEIYVTGADTFQFEVATAATSTVATGGNGAYIFCQFRAPQAATMDFASSSIVTVNLANHNAVPGDTVDLLNFPTTAGVDASLINIRAQVDSVLTSGSFTVILPAVATSSVTGAAGKVVVRRDNGQTGLVLKAWGYFSSSGNTWDSLPTAMGLYGNYNASLTPTREDLNNFTSASDIFKNCGVFYQHAGGYVNGLQITNPTGWGYVSLLQQTAAALTLQGSQITGGDVNLMVGANSTSFGLLSARDMSNVTISGLTGISAGYCAYIVSNSATANVKFNNCNLAVDNPASLGTGVSVLHYPQVFRISDTGSTLTVTDCILSPATTAVGSIFNTIAGATVNAFNNVLGYSAATPTTAGSLGDVYYPSTPTAAVRGWYCSAASSAPGVTPVVSAVWTAF